MSNLRDITDVEAVDVWGETVKARAIVGDKASFAVVELTPGGIVPPHQHHNEQMGICIEGSVTFTIGDERRILGPGGTWLIPSNAPHDAVAGPNGAILLDIFSPARTDWNSLPRSAPKPPVWPRGDRVAGE
jgi:quercetin dioxygenase-like cupin family protein